jgi:hypothetical protein
MITEQIKQKMADEMDARYPDGGVDAARTTFFRGCEYGYSLASSEIEALKKEIQKLKQDNEILTNTINVINENRIIP